MVVVSLDLVCVKGDSVLIIFCVCCHTFRGIARLTTQKKKQNKTPKPNNPKTKTNKKVRQQQSSEVSGVLRAQAWDVASSPWESEEKADSMSSGSKALFLTYRILKKSFYHAIFKEVAK